MIDPNKPWLLIAEDDGPDGNGRVLGYMCFKDEETAQETARRRGEICDWMGLYIGEDIPDVFAIEVMTYDEFFECYRDKMPLKNYVEYYNWE